MGCVYPKPKLCLVTFALSGLCSALSYAEIHRSDLPLSEGRPERYVMANKAFGFDDLLPYALPSPDQEDAGSCLYMAITGVAEWWLAKLNPHLSRVSDGPIDLSERYAMNIAGIEEDEAGLPDWRTDSIYLFNKFQQISLRNAFYRYTKGWYIGEAYSERLIPAQATTEGANYGTLYNWIDQRPTNLSASQVVKLPMFKREILFRDPEHNQWNIGAAPDRLVADIKHALKTKKAPVLVIYNQNSYWHAVNIIGYDDQMDNGQCAYTEKFRQKIAARALDLARQAAAATDPAVKEALRLRAQRAKEAQDKIETAYATRGGCTSSRGAFYIRDSIYPNEQGPVYDYDLSQTGEERPYSQIVVTKEYDWVRYFVNHAVVITAEPRL